MWTLKPVKRFRESVANISNILWTQTNNLMQPGIVIFTKSSTTAEVLLTETHENRMKWRIEIICKHVFCLIFSLVLLVQLYNVKRCYQDILFRLVSRNWKNIRNITKINACLSRQFDVSYKYFKLRNNKRKQIANKLNYLYNALYN